MYGWRPAKGTNSQEGKWYGSRDQLKARLLQCTAVVYYGANRTTMGQNDGQPYGVPQPPKERMTEKKKTREAQKRGHNSKEAEIQDNENVEKQERANLNEPDPNPANPTKRRETTSTDLNRKRGTDSRKKRSTRRETNIRRKKTEKRN